MQEIIIAVYLLFFVLAISLIFYNLLYAKSVFKTNHQLGIALPTNVRRLLLLNILLSLISAAIIVFFLFGYS